MRVALLSLIVLVVAPVAGAHPHPPKLFHPTDADLRALAIRASDLVELEGAKYVGAVGKCRREDRAVVKTGPGWKHVRCYMRTKNGYRFTVTWHVTNAGKIAQTVVRTV